jgi:trans-aconitate methyltransferase
MSRNWDAETYDARHRYVFEMGAGLVDDLNPQAGEMVLDLGCGTGHLTNEIARRGATVVGIDRSEDMIATAKRNYGHLAFAVADALSYQPDPQFDAVFSNAVLHWIQPPEAAIGAIRKALKPGGRLVAEFGGKGNTASILAITRRNPWYFPGIVEYGNVLEANGFELVRAVLYERPTPLEGESGLRDWLKMFYHPPLPEETIAAAEAQLRPKLFRDGTWFLDYRRLRICAVRVA